MILDWGPGEIDAKIISLGKILACPALPGATPRWDARQRINQVWARDFGLGEDWKEEGTKEGEGER
ncbi:MAG: hypothetical protein JRE20_05135 [Deltaproteobacteria bacterium]|nr:hypothetical protein [Deltaproteobacteria bacterium]